MQTKNMALLIEQSFSHDDALALAVRAAVVPEIKAVVPTLLRAALEKAGFAVNEDEDAHAEQGFKKLEHLYRVLIHAAAGEDGVAGQVVAMGASSTADDALLHAVLGYLRERDIAHFGFIVPLEFHAVDPAKITKGTLNEQPFSEETIAKLKSYLTKKRETRAAAKQ
jgi:hypothetical protein